MFMVCCLKWHTHRRQTLRTCGTSMQNLISNLQDKFVNLSGTNASFLDFLKEMNCLNKLIKYNSDLYTRT